MNEKQKIVVLGAGVGGLAAGYFLARTGKYDVTVLEKEMAIQKAELAAASLTMGRFNSKYDEVAASRLRAMVKQTKVTKHIYYPFQSLINLSIYIHEFEAPAYISNESYGK